jgi:hypothetical protein
MQQEGGASPLTHGGGISSMSSKGSMNGDESFGRMQGSTSTYNSIGEQQAKKRKVLVLPKVKAWSSTSFVRASNERIKTHYTPIVSKGSLLIGDLPLVKQSSVTPEGSGTRAQRRSRKRKVAAEEEEDDYFDEYSEEDEDFEFEYEYDEPEAPTEYDSDFSYPSDKEEHDPTVFVGPQRPDPITAILLSSPTKTEYQSVYKAPAKQSDLLTAYSNETLKLMSQVNSHLGKAHAVLNGTKKIPKKTPATIKKSSKPVFKKASVPIDGAKNVSTSLKKPSSESIDNPNQDAISTTSDDTHMTHQAYLDMVDLYGEDVILEAIGPFDRLREKKKVVGLLPPMKKKKKRMTSRQAWLYAQNEKNNYNTWTHSFDPNTKQIYYYDHSKGIVALEKWGYFGKELVKLSKCSTVHIAR